MSEFLGRIRKRAVLVTVLMAIVSAASAQAAANELLVRVRIANRSFGAVEFRSPVSTFLSSPISSAFWEWRIPLGSGHQEFEYEVVAHPEGRNDNQVTFRLKVVTDGNSYAYGLVDDQRWNEYTSGELTYSVSDVSRSGDFEEPTVDFHINVIPNTVPVGR